MFFPGLFSGFIIIGLFLTFVICFTSFFVTFNDYELQQMQSTLILRLKIHSIIQSKYHEKSLLYPDDQHGICGLSIAKAKKKYQ